MIIAAVVWLSLIVLFFLVVAMLISITQDPHTPSPRHIHSWRTWRYDFTLQECATCNELRPVRPTRGWTPSQTTSKPKAKPKAVKPDKNLQAFMEGML